MFKILSVITLLLLAAGSGFFASIMIGLSRMDTGNITWTPQLIGFCVLPVIFLALAGYFSFRK